MNNYSEISESSEPVVTKRTRISQIYNTKEFQESDLSKLKKSCRSYSNKCARNIIDPYFYWNYLRKRVTIFDWLPRIQPRCIGADVVAGVTVGIMCIPQGMADALLASLPAVNGLYVCFFPCLFYAIFGTSPYLAYGPIALVSLFTGIAVEKLTVEFEQTLNVTANSTEYIHEVADYKLTVAASLATLVGIFQLLLGLTGLGVISSYFSDTFVSSYTCASAIHVIASQIKDLFGITNSIKYSGMFNVPKTIVDLCSKLPDSNWKTIIVSVFCIIWLIAFKEYFNPYIKKKLTISFPSELFLVIITTSASYLAKFDEKYGIKIVGDVPSGFPKPRMPDPNLWPKLISDAVVITLIAFSISISMVALFAKKHNKKIDTTQELYAYGLSNILGSFFGCYPSSGSLSRSSVIEGAGAKSMLSGVFCALVLMLVILFVGPLFETLPNACLASIIVSAFKGILLQSLDLFRLWKINKYESLTWLVTFLSVVLMDVDYGLVIGAATSILLVVVKDQFFQMRSLANYTNTSQYVAENFVIDTQHTKLNVKIFKAQRSIYYVNCDKFQEQLFEKCGFSPIDRLRERDLKLKNPLNVNTEEGIDTKGLSDPDIILDFSAVNYIDTSGVKLLHQLIIDFKKIDVTVYICESQDDFIKMLYHMKVLDQLDDNIYLTVNDVLRAKIEEKLNQ